MGLSGFSSSMAAGRWMRLAVLALTALALFDAAPVWAAGRPVAFRGADGRQINGSLTEANRRPAPAVVLLPMMGRPHDDWQAVAQRFADAGITALAIDLPGGGVPGEGGIESWRAEVGAAVSYLVSREVGASSVGVAGASLGATLAAYGAAGDGRVRALALVSPVADYKGVRMGNTLKQLGGRPVFLLGSHKDPYSARSIREFTKGAEGGFETAWSETPAHGTNLLAREPDLVRLLVEWFERVLP
jgi:alpha-beta hydrolase superfamily lysophospholipase